MMLTFELPRVADDHVASSDLLLEPRCANSKVLVFTDRVELPGWVIVLHLFV